MSISINEVFYRLTNEYHQTIEDRLCYIIVLIDSSNDNTCNHKSIIYLRIKLDSPIVLLMKRLIDRSFIVYVFDPHSSNQLLVSRVI